MPTDAHQHPWSTNTQHGRAMLDKRVSNVADSLGLWSVHVTLTISSPASLLCWAADCVGAAQGAAHPLISADETKESQQCQPVQLTKADKATICELGAPRAGYAV